MSLPSPDRGLPRRGFLRLVSGGFATTLGLLMYPVARFLRPKAGVQSGNLEVLAPFKVNELKADAAGNWPAPFNFGGRPCLVIRTKAGEVKAFDAVCTHVECTVQFRSDKQDLFCNCHNGLYDTNGHNVSGPPPRPLKPLDVTLRGKPGQEEILVSRRS